MHPDADRDRRRRERTRTRTLRVGAPFLLFGIFFGGFGGAQEMPRGVTGDLLDRALQDELDVPPAVVEESRSIVPMLVWILGLGAAAFTIQGVRSGVLGVDPRRRAGLVRFSTGDVVTAEVVASSLHDDEARPGTIGALDDVEGGVSGAGATAGAEGHPVLTVIDGGQSVRARREREARAAEASEARETLKLPPHVVEMLAKSRAARAAAEAASAAEPSDEESAPPSSAAGFDILMPR